MIKVIKLIFYSINILFYIYKYKFNEFFSEYFVFLYLNAFRQRCLGSEKSLALTATFPSFQSICVQVNAASSEIVEYVLLLFFVLLSGGFLD